MVDGLLIMRKIEVTIYSFNLFLVVCISVLYLFFWLKFSVKKLLSQAGGSTLVGEIHNMLNPLGKTARKMFAMTLYENAFYNSVFPPTL